MTAFGELCGDGECIWASKICAIKHHGGLIFISGFDLFFVFFDIFIKVRFRKTDRSGNVTHFIENRRTDIENESCLALGKLVEVPKRHAGNCARSNWGINDRSGGFNGREGWIERRDGFVLRLATRGYIKAHNNEASGMKDLLSFGLRSAWGEFHLVTGFTLQVRLRAACRLRYGG